MGCSQALCWSIIDPVHSHISGAVWLQPINLAVWQWQMLFPATEQRGHSRFSGKRMWNNYSNYSIYGIIWPYMLLTSLHNPILGFLPNSLQPLGLIPSHARNPLKRQRRCLHELVLHRLCNLRDSQWLVGGFNHLETILKNMKVNGKDYPIYEMENKTHVWNHQPGTYHGNTLGISMGKMFETTNQLVKPTRLKHCHITKPVTFDLTFVSEPGGVWSPQIPTFTPFFGDSLAQIGETSHPYWGRTILSTGGKSLKPIHWSLNYGSLYPLVNIQRAIENGQL